MKCPKCGKEIPLGKEQYHEPFSHEASGEKVLKPCDTCVAQILKDMAEYPDPTNQIRKRKP